MKQLFKKILPLTIVYTAVVLIFFHGLNNFFLQDDFLNIYYGWTRSFAPHPYIAYRPIPYEIFGMIIFYLLKLNPVSTHLVLLLIHFANIFLLWLLVGKFTKNSRIKFFAAFVYGTSSIHFGVLFWLSASYLLFGTFFLLLFLNLLVWQMRKPTEKKLWLLIFVYLCMIFTNEIFILFPFFIFLLVIFYRRLRNFLVPTFLLSSLSVVLRLYFKAYSTGPDYAFGNLHEIAKTVWWYFLRSLNIAEGIKNMAGQQMNLEILLIALFLLCLAFAVFIFLKAEKKSDKKILFFGGVWFLFFGAPYFVLVNHVSAYYLNTAFVGFAIALSFLWLPVFSGKKRSYKILIIIFLTAYGMLSLLNVSFLGKTSWLVWRGEIARKYVNLAKSLYPTLPKEARLVFGKTTVNHKEISLALYNDKALRLFYSNPQLSVIYDDSYILKPGDFIISD